MKKLLTIILCLLMLCACNNKEKTPQDDSSSKNVAVKEISKYGNIILDKNIQEINDMGIEVADIINVDINGTIYEMPVGTQYSDVDTGKMICRLDEEDDEVAIAINSGNFAAGTGLYTKVSTQEEPGYKWLCDAEVTISLSVKKKQGYKDEYEIKQLVRTYERSDYPDLTDEQYANFRAVFDDILYRSSSPIDNDLNRNSQADAAIKKYAIKTIINLDDETDEMAEYEGYSDTYYSSLNIYNVTMDYEFGNDTFNEAMKRIVEIIIDSDLPVLIHCKEGKDRTGIVCALLEGFNGWSLDEIQDDYMKTYYNYYGVEAGSDKYDLIIKTNLNKALATVLKVDDIEKENVEMKVYEYFNTIGISNEQIGQLQTKLPQVYSK